MSTPSPLDTPGTQYLCQRCGNCCRWPGDVRITDEETKNIAEYLELSEEEFIATQRASMRTALAYPSSTSPTASASFSLAKIIAGSKR
jgi:hypothetical protein